jgi:hypothetical protein
MKKHYTIHFNGTITLKIDEEKMAGNYVDQQDAIWDALNENVSADELMSCVANVLPSAEDEDGCFVPDDE